MQNSKKVIFHIDGDSFFVGCELALRPELRDKDVLISHSKEHSIATAISYSLKRKGVYVPMKLYEVRKIEPNFINLYPNYPLYETMSKRIYQYLKNNVSINIEVGSIDEWYVDVTRFSSRYNSPIDLANKIKKDIWEQIGISVSIGVSYNKWLAKMATDMNKPFGVTLLKKKDIPNFIWTRPIENYIGIGKSMAPKLKQIGIKTIGDLANCDQSNKEINAIFKNKLKMFIDNANGIGDDKINTNNENESIGAQKTFDTKITNDIEVINKHFRNLSDRLEIDLANKNVSGNKISVMIRTSKKSYLSISKSLSFPIFDSNDIYDHTIKLFYKIWDENEISTIGITISSLVNNYVKGVNISFFEKPKDNEREVIKIINDVNKKMKSNKLKLLSNKEV